MKKGQRLLNTTEDREKLEETVTAAEDMIALLKQFGVSIDKNTIRAVDEARNYLNETKPITNSRHTGRQDRD